MTLHKIKDFYPDYRDHFNDHDILGYDLYAGREKIGSIDNLLVDDDGRFRYLVVNTGAWIFGKKVLMPIGRARINYSDRRAYVDGLTRDQVENLPEYNGTDSVDYDYEERVRGVYRPGREGSVDTRTSLDETPGMYDRNVAPGTRDRAATPGAYNRDTYRYDQEPNLFNMNDRDHENLKLYEERLISNKTRQKAGEVTVGKHVETETARVSVPVEKERVVVERTNPTDATVAPGENAFNEGEVARMDVYEETPEIRKETFVREEVNVRKEVDRDTVEAEDQVRRERLDVDTHGNPKVNDRNNPRDRRI
jgi:uncharacterized protein (TIGR02271 family)